MNQHETFGPAEHETLRASRDYVPKPRVLVPVGLSANTRELLECALIFAKRLDAVIELLHVVQLNIAGEERGVPRAGLVQGLAENARGELHKLVEELFDKETPAMIAVREGQIDEVIVQEARATTATMVIMGLTKRVGLFRWFRRDPLRRVIRRAPCPVLVVRAGGVSKSSFPVASVQPVIRSSRQNRALTSPWLADLPNSKCAH